MTRIIRIFLPLAVACLIIPTTTLAFTVVCTSKPACLLVDAVIGEKTTRIQLLPDNADLHHYHLRLSDLRKLSQADVIVRLSPALEHFINPLLDSHSQTVITLADTAKLTYWPIPKQHEHTHQHKHEDKARKLTHRHKEAMNHANNGPLETFDPHFWLDPQNAIKIVHYLTGQLAKINPTQATYYQQNNQHFIKHIQQSDQRIHQLLLTNKHKPYLAFHVGLQYFEKYYGLEAPEIVSVHEGLPIGIKTLRHLRTLIKKTNIHCLITEPRTSEAFIRTLTEATPLTIGVLDPVGSTLLKTHNHYTDLLEHIAQVLHNCLGKTTK